MSLTQIPVNKLVAATIIYTPNPRAQKLVFCERGADSKEATDLCLAAARKRGWSPPKWWQWWRGSDHREPFIDMNAIF